MGCRNNHDNCLTGTLITLWILAYAGLAGCGESTEPTPPEISNLTLAATTTILDGGDEAIYGFFEFADVNADARSVMIDVDLPDGTIDEIGPLELDELRNRKSGSVSFSLVYSRDNAGRYELTVWLLDAKGQASNELTGTIVSRY